MTRSPRQRHLVQVDELADQLSLGPPPGRPLAAQRRSGRRRAPVCGRSPPGRALPRPRGGADVAHRRPAGRPAPAARRLHAGRGARRARGATATTTSSCTTSPGRSPPSGPGGCSGGRDSGPGCWTAGSTPGSTRAGRWRPVNTRPRLRPGWTSPSALPTLDVDAAATFAADGVLVDARAGERYRGEVEPLDPRPGHVPGAVNVSAATLYEDGRMPTDTGSASCSHPLSDCGRLDRRRRLRRTAGPGSRRPATCWPSRSSGSTPPCSRAPGRRGRTTLGGRPRSGPSRGTPTLDSRP